MSRKHSETTTAIEKRQQQGTVNVPDRIPQQAAQPQTYYTPLVDVAETPDAFVFEADLPGARAHDLEVSYDNGTLTIEAKVQPRQPENQQYAWREYGVGHFYRSFTINTPIDADAIKAELKNGVLELYVPKAESAKPKKIQIKSA